MTSRMLPYPTAVFLVTLYLGLAIVNALPIETAFLAVKKPILLLLEFLKVSFRLLHLGGEMTFGQPGFLGSQSLLVFFQFAKMFFL